MTDDEFVEEVKKKFDNKFRGPSELWVEKEEVKRFLGWSIRKVLENNLPKKRSLTNPTNNHGR